MSADKSMPRRHKDLPAQKSRAWGTAGDILARLREIELTLRTSERKLAALVLAEASSVTRMSLASFASAASVSQPTAIRFCRMLGCQGFPDFKISLAQALMVGQPFVHGEIKLDDSVSIIADKIFGSSIDTLQLVRSQLEIDAVERAVEAIEKARRIELFGFGLSSVTAMDANQKLMQLGLPASHQIDVHLQQMAASTLQPGDVAIFFNWTGRIRDVVRIATKIVEQGAKLIAVTRSDSPLARISSIVLGVDTLENTFVYAPMTTRMAQLAVIDVLVTAIALRSGPAGLDRIRRFKRSLQDQWMLDEVEME